MFRNVVSLGFFCSTALELKRLGLRTNSLPFDWTIALLPGVLESIRTNFTGFLDEAVLTRNPTYPYIIKNDALDISFYHDFDETQAIAASLPAVRAKYARRIDSFYKGIGTKTLFLRYILDETERDYIVANYDTILALIKSYHPENAIWFVANTDIRPKAGMPTHITLFYVKKDQGETVARNFTLKNPYLLARLLLLDYPIKQRLQNLYWLISKRFGGKSPIH